MIKFLHAADLHLDSPFAALQPEQARACRQEQREIVEKLFALAEAQQVDLILFSGDLFDSDNAYADTVALLETCCRESHAEIFMAPGNHDCLMEGSAYLCTPWPSNVHIFRSEKIEIVTLDALGLRVYGAGFRGHASPALLEGFRADDDFPSLMVLHGDPVNAGSSYNPITEQQIASSGLTYLALGHLHEASGLRQAGKTFYAWPGCTMGRGFDETGEKGVYLGTLSDDGQVTLSFVNLGARRYEEASVDVSDGAKQAISRVLQAYPADCNLRLTLTGTCDDCSCSKLEQAFEAQIFSLTLRDRTQPGRGLWEGMEEDSVTGLFLQNLYHQYETASDEAARRRIVLAVRLGMDALQGREITE